jgi:hypothetical protein
MQASDVLQSPEAAAWMLGLNCFMDILAPDTHPPSQNAQMKVFCWGLLGVTQV